MSSGDLTWKETEFWPRGIETKSPLKKDNEELDPTERPLKAPTRLKLKLTAAIVISKQIACKIENKMKKTEIGEEMNLQSEYGVYNLFIYLFINSESEFAVSAYIRRYAECNDG